MKTFFSTNYLVRKVLLLVTLSVLVSVAIALIYQFLYYNSYIELDAKEITKVYQNKVNLNWQEYSEAYQTKTLFLALNTVAFICTLISSMLVLLMLIFLFKNSYNGDIFFKWLYLTIVVALVAIFFTISVKPQDTFGEITTPEGFTFQKKINSMNYSQLWYTLFATFTILVLSISAKGKLGYLKKSIFFKKPRANTAQLQKQITEIEETHF
ncbi:hypothetical protein [Mycoplasma buteonis]|uniref:hypothetical protein n=1 Tax=Mycoplasma buteonis TaxID=171280 RepID=UPI00055BEA16|nr:hypothetical protein [Mycoplasma buteonis]